LQNEKEYEFLLTASINGFFVTLSPAELKISNEITCPARTSTSVSVSRGFGGVGFSVSIQAVHTIVNPYMQARKIFNVL
jgi:hypothetical protein